MAGLTSGRMRRLIEEAREAFDWVIIDTPPIGLLPDASLLAVDGRRRRCSSSRPARRRTTS